MPELPEVETIRRDLEKKVINKRINKIKVNLPRLIKKPTIDEFSRRLKGTYITKVSRRGKYILCFLSSGECLVFHLGMSGCLLYETNELPISIIDINKKHFHVFFFFEDNTKMIYNDVRQFGKIWLLKKDDKLTEVESLGLEPLEEDFTIDKFTRIIENKKGNIKSLIMNQKHIAGIGNIYANEILFRAGIHPLRRSNSLTTHEIKKLYCSIKDTLAKAVLARGTTMADESYRDLDGKSGNYAEAIMVYGKKKGNCPLCGRPLTIIRIENRSTYLCTFCQK
ncbi:MAG: bifunctional DNA-formamidopyrimidine glycosylase/DNA-(apurinic or apyrimidinic site) lyase [Atribacterota bacterium]|uniref:Formamidopyrimidine-DNA glycosylase n=1 Tax=uncultured Atribacterota bacterium TaxID=263865 RepID=G3BML3_9BACT|nr:formamidopyrimidine-DNA glycosylase [uncultured Atribacterota bacterium]MDD3539259.1 bifunctional DNA-formamidopyrimidine glycosylase/DNA-(apurinic or apyrimidinic site) lyase [Atribacterota bacterium]MDD5497281.1 bifunctional DNA-formamidopyrimidine glycosylase/DNA-(apurinic or apyrimidinic site) lyase [Atribacterota bacterium]